MKKKLTRDEIQLTICDMFWDMSNSDCKQCPYFTKKGECSLRKDLEKVFTSAPAPAPIPTADKWVEQICSKFAEDNRIAYSRAAKYVIVVDVAKDAMALAHCSRKDNFDLRVGIAIAYARLYNLPIHPEYASKKDKVLGRDN